MELFQILDCSTLGTCCTDYGVVGILSVTKMVFDLIQLVVPIILIVAGTIQFVQLTINPELKDGFRRVLNKFMAAVIVFLLPALVDLILTATSSNFSVAACWKQARGIAIATPTGGGVFMPSKYIATDEDGDNSVWMNPSGFESLTNERMNKEENNNNNNNNGGTSTSSKTVSAKQKAIVAYAKQFLNRGYKYKYKGSWDCTGSYKPTDCSGFVKCVYKNAAGATIPRKANNMWLKRAQYFEVVSEKDRQAGDIIYYGGSGHVGIYTGKGKEIIHNKGYGYGIVKESNYNKASKHGKPKGFLRLKGVKE